MNNFLHKTSHITDLTCVETAVFISLFNHLVTDKSQQKTLFIVILFLTVTALTHLKVIKLSKSSNAKLAVLSLHK